MLIKTEHLQKKYGEHLVLKQVDLSLSENGLYFITGENGAGKSTFLKIIGLLDEDFDGELSILGHQIKKLSEKKRAGLRKKYLAFLFQGGNDLSFCKAKDNGEFRAILWNNEEKEAKESPSQGERILDYLNEAMLSKKPILLLDEPTANLSERNSLLIYQKLKEISKKKCVIVVTHDDALLKQNETIISLKNGELNYIQKEKEERIQDIPRARRNGKGFLLGKVIKKDFLPFLLVFIATFSFLFMANTVSIGLFPSNQNRLVALYQNGDETSLIYPKAKVITGGDGKTHKLNDVASSFIDEKSYQDLLKTEIDYTFFFDSIAYKNLNRDIVCLVPESNKESFTYHEDKVLINGRYLPYTLKKGIGYKAIVNLSRYEDYERVTPFQTSGFVYSKDNSFSSSQDKKAAFDTNLRKNLVSPSILKTRGYAGDMYFPENEIYLSSLFQNEGTATKQFFFDYSSYDLHEAWRNYVNYRSLYKEGATLIYKKEIASYLKENEFLVSQSIFDEAAKQIAFSSINLTISNPKKDLDYVFSHHFSLSFAYSSSLNERKQKIESIWKASSDAKTNTKLFAPIALFSLLLLLGVDFLVFLRLSKRGKKDALLLLSFGYSRVCTTWILDSSLFFSSALSTLCSVLCIPFSAYLISGDILMMASPLLLLPITINLSIQSSLFLILLHRQKAAYSRK